MSDGDQVHSHLRRPYQKPYKILCEDLANSDHCVRGLLEALKNDLRQFGKWPLLLFREIADLFSQCIGALGFSNDAVAARISREIDERIRRAGCSPHEKELFARASKTVLAKLRNGHEMKICNGQLIIFETYIHEKYEAEFKDRIPLSREHHNRTSHGELLRRLEALQPDVDRGIHGFAKSAIKSQNLNSLRLPQRQLHDIDLNENLLAS